MLKRRPDGRLAPGLAPYRRMMPYLMRSRTESVVLFEQNLEMTGALEFIEKFNANHPGTPITPFHLVVWGAVRTFDRFPHLNRFVAGGKIWDRDGIWISYSAKKEFSEDAPIVVVKRCFSPNESFPDMVAGMHDELQRSRSPERSYTDRELDVVLKFQGLPLRVLMLLQRVADAWGLLPRSFIERDPLFASLFIANLGSLKMDPGFHHLFEYGSISIFCMVGRIKGNPPQLGLRFTYDERIEDGFYANRALGYMRSVIEDPAGGNEANRT